MSWSLGETRALAVKATRGCGFSWGLAEEAGFAIQWLQARGAPGVPALSKYLQICDTLKDSSAVTFPIKEPLNEQKTYHPLSLGTYMLDAERLISIQKIPIFQPLLLVPFLATMSEQSTHSLNWRALKHHILITTNNMLTQSIPPDLIVDQAICTIARIQQPSLPSKKPHLSRTPSSMAEDIIHLEHFAARTYAPETEASRLSGAGAGVYDND